MIHETAIVHPEAQIDPEASVGPFCRIGPHVKIGKGTNLHSHIIVEGDTVLGEKNEVFPFAVIGAVPQDLKYKGEPTRVRIGNHNIIRESVTINLGTIQDRGETTVGDHNLLMGCVHLGHDAVIHNHCILANFVGVAGHVVINDYAFVGGQCGVSQFIQIGTHAYVGGQSGIDKDVPPFTIAQGSRPFVIKGSNIVGLKRRGFSVEEVQMINEAVKLWTRPDVEKDRCLLEIESQYGENIHIQKFVEFIRNSKCGVARS